MRFTIAIFLLLICLELYSQETEKKIFLHVTNITFQEFSGIINDKSGHKVYYRDEWVETIIVNLDADSITPMEAIKFVLQGRNLKVSLWNDHYVILPDQSLISTLPDFSQQGFISDSGRDDGTEQDKQYLRGRSSDVVRSITVGNRAAIRSGSVLIKGKISDIESGEPIIGATLFISETSTGSVTDLNGDLNIRLKQGKYTVRFECMGYRQLVCQLNVNSDGSFHVEMARDNILIEETTIFGDRQMIITAKDPGIEKIAIKSIKEIPMMLGERDILRVSEMLPGIVSVGEGASGLNVRGGNFDQNAFYINNVPVYNTSHLFGFFPAFNADVINDFTIYKGHVPAQYGGKLSSVFDIETRQGSRERFSMHGGINPISANMTLSGPLINDSLTYLISGRASYSDWILTRMDDHIIRNSKAGFYDFTSSISYDLKKTSINAFLYNSNDRFKLADLNEYEYSNLGASFNVDHHFTNFLSNHFSLVGSQYSYGTTDQQEISNAYKHAYRLQHYELRNDINHNSGQHTLNYGIDLAIYSLDRGLVEPYGPESLRTPVDHGTEQAMNGALYVSDTYDLFPWMNLSAGFRFSLYSYLGPRKVYIYQDENHRDIRLISDTIYFKSGEAIKWYSSPEFRLAVNLTTDPNGSVKLAFNQMNQHLF
ncbi:carboxypeptidase-like regulatory domain-containing protein, partial [Bacteroidota bacterium]